MGLVLAQSCPPGRTPGSHRYLSGTAGRTADSAAYPWLSSFSPLLPFEPAHADHDRVCRTERAAFHHHARVGPHRCHRLRRPARPHRALAETLRRRPCVVERSRVRRRHLGYQSAAGPCLDPAGYLLCLAAARTPGRSHRRHLLHRPGARDHLGPLRTVLGGAPAPVGSRSCGRCWRSGARRRAQRRCRPHSRQLAEDGRCTSPQGPLALLLPRRSRLGGHHRSVPRARPARLRPH